MNRTDIRETLDEESIRLTKSLGQNLLHDQNVLRRIVKAGDLSPADKVLEIGPGLGALTEHLLPAGEHGNVIAFTPAITITEKQLEQTIRALQSSFAKS